MSESRPFAEWAPAWLRLRAAIPPGERSVGVLHEVAAGIETLAGEIERKDNALQAIAEKLCFANCHTPEFDQNGCPCCDPVTYIKRVLDGTAKRGSSNGE